LPTHDFQETALLKYVTLKLKRLLRTHLEYDSDFIIDRILRNRAHKGPGNKRVQLPFTITKFIFRCGEYGSNGRMVTLVNAFVRLCETFTSQESRSVVTPLRMALMLLKNLVEIEIS
jgi:hypothetical protein